MFHAQDKNSETFTVPYFMGILEQGMFHLKLQNLETGMN